MLPGLKCGYPSCVSHVLSKIILKPKMLKNPKFLFENPFVSTEILNFEERTYPQLLCLAHTVHIPLVCGTPISFRYLMNFFTVDTAKLGVAFCLDFIHRYQKRAKSMANNQD